MAYVDLVVADPRMAAGAEPVLAGTLAVLGAVRGSAYGAGTLGGDGITPRAGCGRSKPTWQLDLEVVQVEVVLVGASPRLDQFKEMAVELRQQAEEHAAALPSKARRLDPADLGPLVRGTIRGVQSMSASTSPATGRQIASILWFPFLFAIALPLIFQLAFHAPQPHQVSIAVVGSVSQVEGMSEELRTVNSGGFRVEQSRSTAAALSAVRDRGVAAAFLETSPTHQVLYVAKAASAIRAAYLQGVFTQLAQDARTSSPHLVDVVPLLPGDSGNAVFFFVFPMLMVGIITVLILLQRAQTWSIGYRVLAVAGMGAVGAAAAYITVVDLNALPNKPPLLFYAFFISQIFGQLLLGAAPILKQYFLPIAMTFTLVVGIPSAGGTVPPDLLPVGLRYLSNVLPLAQGVRVIRSVAYFHGEDLLPPTMILVAWAVVALIGLAFARHRGRPPDDTRWARRTNTD